MTQQDKRLGELCEQLYRGEITPDQFEERFGALAGESDPCMLAEWFQGYLGGRYLPEEEGEDDGGF